MRDKDKTKEQSTEKSRDIRKPDSTIGAGKAQKAHAERLQKGNAAPRILIVEDSSKILKPLTDILANHVYQVRHAASGQAALKLAAEEKPDLILLDTQLPDMEGHEVCRRLKSNKKSRMIPVIFIGLLDEASVKIKGFDAGAIDYITKPFRQAEVLAKVKTHLNLRRLQDQLDAQNLELQQETNIRKQTEAALRQAERLASDAIDFMPDATFAIDREGIVIVWNRAMEELTMVKAEDMLGKGDHEYSLPFYGTRRPKLIDLVLKADAAIEKQYLFVRRRGGALLAEAMVTLNEENVKVWEKASPLYNEKGDIVGAIESIRDITEHTLTEESLRRAEAEYRGIFENAQEGIFRSTIEGRFIIANQALASMLYYSSPKELLNAITDIPHQLYVNPDEHEVLKQMIKDYGPTKGFETQYYRKDGAKIWVSVNMQAVSDTDGQMLYYEGIIEDITVSKKAEEERKWNIQRLRQTVQATIQAMAMVVEARDPYTAGHQRRVSNLALTIATEMGLSRERIDGIRMMGAIHDIGKISIPAEILSKPTKLNDMEFGLIKAHAQAGYDILKEIDFPWPVAEIILQHHEKLNGSGYPQGLKGDEILLEARIVGLADKVEAMASHRPYRPSLGLEEALADVYENRGTLYDADAVDVCMKLFHEKHYQMNG
ncbi:MAG: HD domain-containing phosphohydrolase [Syntrophales bacterium]|jgi:PAS domain S-box-containing protein